MSRLDGYIEKLRSEAKTLRKKGSKSALGKVEAELREALAIAENAKEKCAWTYKGYESPIEIKEPTQD